MGRIFSIFRGPVGSHASYGAADKAASQYGFIIISPHAGSGGEVWAKGRAGRRETVGSERVARLYSCTCSAGGGLGGRRRGAGGEGVAERARRSGRAANRGDAEHGRWSFIVYWRLEVRWRDGPRPDVETRTATRTVRVTRGGEVGGTANRTELKTLLPMESVPRTQRSRSLCGPPGAPVRLPQARRSAPGPAPG